MNIQALAASGLRSIRYAREVDGIDQVIAVDNDKGNAIWLSILSYLCIFLMHTICSMQKKKMTRELSPLQHL